MGIYAALANLSCGMICFVLAVTFRKNKNATNYIAGYNTMTAEEQTKYSEKEMCQFLSNRLFFYSALMVITGIIIAFNIYIWATLIGSWVVFSIVFVNSAMHLAHSKKFKT